MSTSINPQTTGGWLSNAELWTRFGRKSCIKHDVVHLEHLLMLSVRRMRHSYKEATMQVTAGCIRKFELLVHSDYHHR